jgi:phosphoribosylformimino-5-aminoimidazole carboxamide ribotide isomerase
MILLPAIDLLGGHVVSLVGGVPGTQTVDLPNPTAVYERWLSEGAEWLHVVDLDAAFEQGHHQTLITAWLKEQRARIQVAGGLRSSSQIRSYLEQGAQRAVVGTKGIEDAAWLAQTASELPGRIVLAVDAWKGRVLTKGWRTATDRRVVEVVREASRLPLAGFLFTAVDVEGKLQGLDRNALAQVRAASGLPVMASGGVTGYDDLTYLRDLGVEGAVLGAAHYKNLIELPAAKRLVEGA